MLTTKSLNGFPQRAALLLPHSSTHWVAGAAGALLFMSLVIFLWRRSLRPSAGEQERRRREQLASTGRITTGELLEARTLEGHESYSTTPEVLLYSYRLAGVTYSCAQDVSTLPERVRGFSIEGPVQVRYDPRNPCNSVLVAENWSGLWLTGQHG